MDESYLEKISRAQKHMLRASELVNKFGSPTQSEWTCDTPDTIPSRHISIMKMTPYITQDISGKQPMFHVTKSIYRVVEHGKMMWKQFTKPAWIPYENLAVQSDKSTFVRTTKDKHFVWADEFSLSAEQKNFSYELKQYVYEKVIRVRESDSLWRGQTGSCAGFHRPRSHCQVGSWPSPADHRIQVSLLARHLHSPGAFFVPSQLDSARIS